MSIMIGSTKLSSLYLCRARPICPIGDSDGAVADTSAWKGNGSRLYKLNLWMWRYGRGQPRHVTVAEAEQRRKERTRDARRRAAATLKLRREEREPADDDSADSVMIERHMLQMNDLIKYVM
jgi:hypothetical protein